MTTRIRAATPEAKIFLSAPNRKPKFGVVRLGECVFSSYSVDACDEFKRTQLEPGTGLVVRLCTIRVGTNVHTAFEKVQP